MIVEDEKTNVLYLSSLLEYLDLTQFYMLKMEKEAVCICKKY